MFGSDTYLLCLVGAVLVLVLVGSCSESANTNETGNLRSCSGENLKGVVKMGVIVDNSSRLGREQLVAIQMAFQQQHDHLHFSNSCQKFELLLRNSPDNSAQATATGEPIKEGLARLVLGPWLFGILIVTASFTASLSSMMTITMSKPWVYDIETLKLKNATVGCTTNSILIPFLSQASIPPQNVKQIPSLDLFPKALENGDIQAALFTAPHARIFLAKYCKGLTKLTLFKLLGMGFAFPKGSPLTLDISLSMGELMERKEMPDFEATLLSTYNCSNNNIDGLGLGPGPFAGLFLIAGVVAFIAVLFTATRLILLKYEYPTSPLKTSFPSPN